MYTRWPKPISFSLPSLTPWTNSSTLIPLDWLDWEQRWPLLIKAIRDADADIVALQEVDHVGQWIEAMSDLGYEGQVRHNESHVTKQKEMNAVSLH